MVGYLTVAAKGRLSWSVGVNSGSELVYLSASHITRLNFLFYLQFLCRAVN
jgi:hypothetical protein